MSLSSPGLADAVNLAMTLLSIALSVIAIWLSIHFYRLSNDVSGKVMQAIADLTVSAKTTEATTTRITSRALDVLADHFEHRVDEAERESRVKVAQSVGRALAEAPPEERHEAQAAATRAVSEAFLKLKTSVAPTSHEYDWGPFIRRMDELQRNNLYLSVKWLHRTVFGDEPGMQEALQIAIERDVLKTFRRENPDRPQYPTLCCELNPSHPAVVSALAGAYVRAPAPARNRPLDGKRRRR